MNISVVDFTSKKDGKEIHDKSVRAGFVMVKTSR
jgi:hypothetical protein